jgi:hypothetical protein
MNREPSTARRPRVGLAQIIVSTPSPLRSASTHSSLRTPSGRMNSSRIAARIPSAGGAFSAGWGSFPCPPPWAGRASSATKYPRFHPGRTGAIHRARSNRWPRRPQRDERPSDGGRNARPLARPMPSHRRGISSSATMATSLRRRCSIPTNGRWRLRAR